MTQDELDLTLSLPGWCGPRKMLDLYRVIRSLAESRPVRGVEIGVLGGRSLIPAAIAIRDAGTNGHVVGIDPYGPEFFDDGVGLRPPEPPPWPGGGDLEACRALAQQAARKVGLNWVSLLVAPARTVARFFGPIDYLHIDGNHTSDVALADAATWMEKLSAGGLAVIDDCDFESVQPARQYVASKCRERLVRVERADDPNDYEIWVR